MKIFPQKEKKTQFYHSMVEIEVEFIIGIDSITDQTNSLKFEQSAFCFSFSLLYNTFTRGGLDQNIIIYS